MGFVKHLFDAHNTEETFNYICGISSCTRSFVTGATFEAFRDHCTRYHHNWKQEIIPTMVAEERCDAAFAVTTGNKSDSSTDDDMHLPLTLTEENVSGKHY